jgi:hypothetical protein
MNPATLSAVTSMAQGALGEALSSSLSNPSFNTEAFDASLQGAQQAVFPGSSAMYHYAWAAGLGTVSVSNFMIAWHLPSERRFLKGIALTTGVLSAAATYLNVQKARSR